MSFVRFTFIKVFIVRGQIQIKKQQASPCQTQFLQYWQLKQHHCFCTSVFCQRLYCQADGGWRLEVKIKGHYLQPERAASASSFSSSSLPACDLDRTKSRRLNAGMHRMYVTAASARVHAQAHT